MVKILSIFFSMMIILQSVNIHFDDIIDVEKIIEHANLHQEKYGDSFLTFLSKHYGDLKEDHKTQHQEEEKNCENHNHHDCLAHSHLDLLVNQQFLSFNSLKFIECSKAHSHYQDKFSTFEKQKLLRPPQYS